MITNFVDDDSLLCCILQFDNDFVLFFVHFRWWTRQDDPYQLFRIKYPDLMKWSTILQFCVMISVVGWINVNLFFLFIHPSISVVSLLTKTLANASRSGDSVSFATMSNSKWSWLYSAMYEAVDRRPSRDTTKRRKLQKSLFRAKKRIENTKWARNYRSCGLFISILVQIRRYNNHLERWIRSQILVGSIEYGHQLIQSWFGINASVVYLEENLTSWWNRQSNGRLSKHLFLKHRRIVVFIQNDNLHLSHSIVTVQSFNGKSRSFGIGHM